MKAKVRHSKIKNTGIIFEVLTRQLTADLLSGVESSKAQEIIERNFKSNTELGKEHRLYQALLKYKLNDSDKAKHFINEVIDAHRDLNKSELRKEKYRLIGDIKKNYNVESLFKTRLDNYKLFASIYKIFQFKSFNEEMSPEESVDARFTILENITGNGEKGLIVDVEKNELKQTMDEYSKQTADLRLLTYKLLIDKFNDKYKGLDDKQKRLIKEYINNTSSTNSLMEYIDSELPNTIKCISNLSKNVKDRVTQIKINEVVNQLKFIKENNKTSDSNVSVMLNAYELIKELKNLENMSE